MEKTLALIRSRQGLEPRLNVTPLVWIITIAVTIAFFVYEFYAHVRKPHEPTIGESARWSAFYIGLALLFGVGIGAVSGWTYGGEYFAGLPDREGAVDRQPVRLPHRDDRLRRAEDLSAEGADDRHRDRADHARRLHRRRRGADRELLLGLLPLRRPAAVPRLPSGVRARRVQPRRRQVHALRPPRTCRSATSTTATS